MGDEIIDERTFKEKLLFYTTAFFILLGTFSMFAFLFLVPFVIEPAFTTIFMQFEEVPALCETFTVEKFFGARNCSWASCREGCTKDIYECTQIRVNYRLNLYNYTDEFNFTEYHINLAEAEKEVPPVKRTDRYERAIRDYDYPESSALAEGGAGLGAVVDSVSVPASADLIFGKDDDDAGGGGSEGVGSDDFLSGDISDFSTFVDSEPRPFDEISELNEGLLGNHSGYFYVGARLFPNVKGCGYPPMLNCTIWLKRYLKLGIKFPCYYSKVDPSLVISNLDYWQNTLNLIYSMAIPIPSFIISVIYLTYAYFKIYNEDEETAPLDKNAEDMDIDEDGSGEEGAAENEEGGSTNIKSVNSDNICVDVISNGGMAVGLAGTPGGCVHTGDQSLQSPCSQMTPNSDINSFGHQLKVQMADDLSRDSLDGGVISNSNSVQGNLSKTMTTSISTPPGPTAAV